MLIKYTPDQLDVETPKTLKDLFEGHIEIKAPSYPERLRLPKELGMDALSEEGNVAKSLAQLEVLAKCAEKIREYISGVQIKHKENGIIIQELKSVEDLYDYPAAGVLVTGLCTKFILGFLEKKV